MTASQTAPNNTSLVIACGALAHEIEAIKRKQPVGFAVKCLNANLHNHPERIPDKVEQLILAHRDDYDNIFVAYGDCGTGGLLDKVLQKYGVERLPGAHCYQFFSPQTFADIDDADLGTFYLTDFLARHFERLILREMGIAENPEFRDMIFGHYHTLLYLIQSPEQNYREQAIQAAQSLNLQYKELVTGYAGLAEHLIEFSQRGQHETQHY